MKRTRIIAYALVAGLVSACSGGATPTPSVDGGVDTIDMTVPIDQALPCDPLGDWDQDTITNGQEGCLEGRDSDGDGKPDWKDHDSDNDGIMDRDEVGKAGECPGSTWPCDSDGDNTPDYLDPDSDNDGLLDIREDLDGNGLFGCCLTVCGKPHYTQEYDPLTLRGCPLNAAGCGPGQRCQDGLCYPPKAFACSDGETDPQRKDSFGDGASDYTRGSAICRPAIPGDPRGWKVVTRIGKALNSPAAWFVLLERSAAYRKLPLDDASLKRAASLDYLEGREDVTAFIVSLPGTRDTLTGEVEDIFDTFFTQTPVGLAHITVQDHGRRSRTVDDYEQRQGITVELGGSGADLSLARNDLLTSLLGDTALDPSKLPNASGTTGSRLTLRLSVIRRYTRAKESSTSTILRDAQGIPLEAHDQAHARRVIIVGALARHADYANVTRNTGVRIDDLVMGNAVVDTLRTDRRECDVFDITDLADGATLELEFPATSVSLKVALDGVVVPRSRQRGFMYHPKTNAIELRNVSGPRGKLVVSYQYWAPIPLN